MPVSCRPRLPQRVKPNSEEQGSRSKVKSRVDQEAHQQESPTAATATPATSSWPS
jgi:hypothetical protein